MDQVGWAEFPIKASWEVVQSDRAACPIATTNELHRIVIIRDWVTKTPSFYTQRFPLGRIASTLLFLQ